MTTRRPDGSVISQSRRDARVDMNCPLHSSLDDSPRKYGFGGYPEKPNDFKAPRFCRNGWRYILSRNIFCDVISRP